MKGVGGQLAMGYGWMEDRRDNRPDGCTYVLYVENRSAAVLDFKSCRRVLTEIMLDEHNDRHPSYYPKSV